MIGSLAFKLQLFMISYAKNELYDVPEIRLLRVPLLLLLFSVLISL